MNAAAPSSATPKPQFDPKAWARRIVACYQAGEKVNKTALEMARSALRIDGGRYA